LLPCKMTVGPHSAGRKSLGLTLPLRFGFSFRSNIVRAFDLRVELRRLVAVHHAVVTNDADPSVPQRAKISRLRPVSTAQRPPQLAMWREATASQDCRCSHKSHGQRGPRRAYLGRLSLPSALQQLSACRPLAD